MTEVGERLLEVEARITEACRAAGRPRAQVRLVAVSKKQPQTRVLEAYQAGQRAFGENYIQELEERVASLPEDIEWHFVGHLQRNKAKKAVELASLIHTVDSTRIAAALSAAAAARDVVAPVLLQVNVDREGSKSGVLPEALDEAAASVGALPHLSLRGLMAIPEPGAGRRAFAALRTMAEGLRPRLGLPLPELSMGMSADFEAAILEGATLVRVGTDIFGARSSGI